MKDSDRENDPNWDRGWDEHEKRQLRRLARLPLAEKLEWLEEAERLGRSLLEQTNRKAARDSGA